MSIAAPRPLPAPFSSGCSLRTVNSQHFHYEGFLEEVYFGTPFFILASNHKHHLGTVTFRTQPSILCIRKNLNKRENMTTQMQAIKAIENNFDKSAPNWKTLYRVGGMAALGTVLVGLVEMDITFLPGGNTVKKTVFDWFTLFQNNRFMGLRDLGLLNILFYALD